MRRREFVTKGLGLAGSLALAERAAASDRSDFAAIAFDAFPVFDPRPVAALCETLFPGRGSELVALWRLRQFEYTWLRTVSNRYADFAQVTEDALVFACRALRLELAPETRDRLLAAHYALKAWPDAVAALTQLGRAGKRIAFLSNFTPGMLKSCIETAGLAGIFHHVLSTDLARAYKPDARAYQLGVDAFDLPRDKILFVAFAGWDAAGAKSFGYPTFWVNRLGLPPEELGIAPDAAGSNLTDLLDFLSR